jgi:ribosomal protein S18 acetylase RimI-like enzyme
LALSFAVHLRARVRTDMPTVDRRGPIDVDIREEPLAELGGYATITIAFEVRNVFDVSGSPGAWTLTERAVEEPYIKDYDANEAERPASWARRFDISRWVMLVARHEDQPIGVAVVAMDTPRLEMLEGRKDVAALWDIRVAPAHRGRRVGTALFDAAEDAAVQRGCRVLRVETQNNNVAACRLYEGRGCTLEQVAPGAYSEFPDEVKLIWSKILS